MRIEPTVLAIELEKLFPNASSELHFSNTFECLCAVLLSAQTTDAAVNKVTPALFSKYPNAFALAKAELSDVENHIRSIGLYKNKAKNLISLSKILVENYGGEVPSHKAALQKLPGVGIKTANVVCAQCFGIPAIAVDTHVARVSKRLGYAKEDATPEEIEKILEKKFPEEIHIAMHHRLIFFGRRICHAISPACGECPFTEGCRYFKKTSSKTGK